MIAALGLASRPACLARATAAAMKLKKAGK
jgi:hypothetical protein